MNVLRQTFIPLQAFVTNILKKSSVVINAENYKNVVATQDTVFRYPSRTCKLPGQYLPIWLLKVNWCVIQFSVVIRSSGYAFVQQVIGLHQQHKDYLIVGRDAILYTTVVEEPAVFVYR